MRNEEEFDQKCYRKRNKFLGCILYHLGTYCLRRIGTLAVGQQHKLGLKPIDSNHHSSHNRNHRDKWHRHTVELTALRWGKRGRAVGSRNLPDKKILKAVG